VSAGRTAVMGILNVTPDSFFEGSRVLGDDAVARGAAMAAAGASILDVGGESTRPGAQPVDVATELDRVVPVLEALRGTARLSVDTVKPEVARAAVAAGATLLNDVKGSLGALAAELGVGWVAMHHRGIPASTSSPHVGPGIVAEVTAAALAAAREAQRAGVTEIYCDPGLGFGKDTADNLALLAHLGEFCEAAHDEGFKVLVGASRKRFVGALADGAALEVDDRMEGSLAVATWAMACGADVVRVHDVAVSVQAAVLAADEEVAA